MSSWLFSSAQIYVHRCTHFHNLCVYVPVCLCRYVIVMCERVQDERVQDLISTAPLPLPEFTIVSKLCRHALRK